MVILKNRGVEIQHTMKRVLITGATGMIGGLILEHCLKSQEIARITSLLRRPTGQSDSKLDEIIIENFLKLDTIDDKLSDIDIVFYCQGVYTGAVDRETFRQITVDYPETLANALAKQKKDLSFCLLSGKGADRTERSRMMFAMDKGIIENRLSNIGFRSFHAFRPGYIYPVTPREEPNSSYKLFRLLYPLVKLLGKNSSITSEELAAAMFGVALHGSRLEILENRDILEQLAR